MVVKRSKDTNNSNRRKASQQEILEIMESSVQYTPRCRSQQTSKMNGLATIVNPLSANFTKWSNTLKQFVGNLPTNWLSAFGHFVGLAFKRLKI